MKYLNFTNVEELIFKNDEVQKILPPQFESYFESWKLGKRLPMLRQLSKTSVIDFLNHLQEEHIELLENYFNDRIIIEKLNYDITMNLKINIEDSDICNQLCNIVGFRNFTLYRDERYIYITLWR